MQKSKTSWAQKRVLPNGKEQRFYFRLLVCEIMPKLMLLSLPVFVMLAQVGHDRVNSSVRSASAKRLCARRWSVSVHYFFAVMWIRMLASCAKHEY